MTATVQHDEGGNMDGFTEDELALIAQAIDSKIDDVEAAADVYTEEEHAEALALWRGLIDKVVGMQAPAPKVRKITRMEFCRRHAGWFAGCGGPYRRAECMVEGGPGYDGAQGCDGGTCRLWPGTDIFDPAVCTSEMALDWTTKPEAVTA